MRFAEQHPDRGIPYTPIAFLLDPAHGWDMTDYPQWPFEVSQINRSDRALRELFGVAYYPGLVMEGEPATGDRQAFVNGVFGDIFDVLVASEFQHKTSDILSNPTTPTRRAGDRVSTGAQSSKTKAQSREIKAAASKSNATRKEDLEYEGSNPSGAPAPASPADSIAKEDRPASAGDAINLDTSPRIPAVSSLPIPASPLDAYRAVVVGGHIEWTKLWVQRLTDYVKSGGTVVLNSAQINGLPTELLGVRLTGVTALAHNAVCLSPGESAQDLRGQIFPYERLELNGAVALMRAIGGDPLVTVNKVGKGTLVFAAVPDLLGEDERMTPVAAHMLAHVFADATPVKVNGDVEYLVNRNKNGWVVTLINNKGVFKPQQGMAQVDRSAYVNAELSLPGARIARAQEWLSGQNLEIRKQAGISEGVTVSIPPGGIAIVELQLQ